MAFMTPLVKKRYDIYDHSTGSVTKPIAAAPISESTTFHQKSLKLVNKLFRLVVDKSKSAERKPSPALGAVVVPVPKPKIASPPAKTKQSSSSSSPVVVQKAAAAVPVPTPAKQPQSQAISIPKSAISKSSPSSPKSSPESSSPKSPLSISPPSRPIPHIRRTMRDSATNRVYSYSVSIPDYVLEESEEELEQESQEESATRCISSSAPLQFKYENSSHLAAPH